MTHDIVVLTHVLQVCLVIAAMFTTSFPVVYAFFPWRSTRLGKILMGQGVSFALTLDLTVLFQFWEPSNILVLFWVEAFGFALIAVSTGALTWMMLRVNSRRRKFQHISKNTKEPEVV